MEQIVSIFRCKKTRRFLLNPMGAFIGYGAFVGIFPYRELPKDVEPAALGNEVLVLLNLSVRTGFKLADIDEYRKAHSDVESQRVRDKYFSRIKGTRDSTRKFQQMEISRTGQATLKLTRFGYSTELRSLIPAETARIRTAVGADGIGAEILRRLP